MNRKVIKKLLLALSVGMVVIVVLEILLSCLNVHFSPSALVAATVVFAILLLWVDPDYGI